jgi:serine/threonine protein kinase
MERVLAGRYELEVPLGRGGSGEVWRGRDMATRRPVAIKIVELSQIDDPGQLAETIGRFRREAMVVGGLRHPNIVGSLDAGRIGNQLFMIMELAPGISLAGMMDERGARGMGLFPVSSVLRIAGQVSSGLAAAHDTGVVHRDIKPSNLMVTPQLGIKIIDFGIAQLLADNSPRLTMRGHTVGTVAYMSPEQAQGDEVDGRADLYSLGCVLYQLLSGRLPFRSSLPSALLMMQVMDQAIPLSALRPDLPAGLTDLVSDLMEKDKAARPDDAAQVISRIEVISGGYRDAEPQHEADRQTIRAADEGSASGLTRAELVLPESGRPTVLTPERLAGLSGQQAAAAPRDTQDAGPRPVTDPRAQRLPTAAWDAPPQSRISGALPGWDPPQARSSGALALRRDQAPAVRGNSGGPPVWPTPVPPRRRRRRRWSGVLSTLLTLALAAGVLAFVWERTHGKLSVTSVKVQPGKESVGCDGTEHIVGTITTNGRGGLITYEWILSDPKKTPKVLTAEDGTGKATVQVALDWAFHGKGTGQAVAKLRVLTPDSAEESIIFPYSCPT